MSVDRHQIFIKKTDKIHLVFGLDGRHLPQTVLIGGDALLRAGREQDAKRKAINMMPQPPLREPDRPMVCVSWSQAENYCFWKGRRLPGAFRRPVRRYGSMYGSRCGSRRRGSIDRADRRPGRKGGVRSFRSGRR